MIKDDDIKYAIMFALDEMKYKHHDTEDIFVQFLERLYDAVEWEDLKTVDYCDSCNHEGCDICISNANDPYCIPSSYEKTSLL